MDHTISYGRTEFREYLKGTLIPDLKESGELLTAADFEQAAKYIRSVKGHEVEAALFCQYLTRTLIPDLLASGRTCTADDFKFAVEFIMHRDITSLSLIAS